MADENQGLRMTAFRRANKRRARIRKLAKAAAAGACMAVFAVGIAFAQPDAKTGRGTFENPCQVEELRIETGASLTEPAKTEPVLETEPQFEYVGDLEVAAYCMEETEYTYSGEPALEGRTAAGDLSVFKIGDQVLVDGNLYVIEDKIGRSAREGICLYFKKYEDAMGYGRKTVPVYRYSPEPEMKEGYLGVFEVTAYCCCEQCCGSKPEKLTRTETVPRPGHTVAVDPSVIPLGTQLVIDGDTYLAEDTGQAIKGCRLDIYFDTHEEAVRYGRKEKHVYLKE